MKTFESEFAELANWIREKNKEDSEAIRKNYKSGVKDGKYVNEREKVVNQYNRRLRELKKKYGKEILAQEQTVRNNLNYASGK